MGRVGPPSRLEYEPTEPWWIIADADEAEALPVEGEADGPREEHVPSRPRQRKLLDYAALAIGFPLLLRGVYQPLLSMPRFELLAFPLFVALAMFTDTRPRAHRAVVAVSLVLLAALTVKFAVFAWVA